jgi:GTP 3',8-cyclase
MQPGGAMTASRTQRPESAAALAPSGSSYVGLDPRLGVPVYVTVDSTLRVKVIDACGMACTFCHNEGTPVAADQADGRLGRYTEAGRSGRVSIYVGRNGARFLPAAVTPDEEFASALNSLQTAVGVTEVHLTGGEPTLHPQLPEIIRLARSAGCRVSATSNGEDGGRALPACAAAGLDRVNFSIFGTTGEELAQVQHPKFANRHRGERKISALRESVRTARHHGIRTSANIVVPDASHAPRVHRLLTEYEDQVSLRLLISLGDGQRSIEAIEDLLSHLRAEPVARYFTAGASDCRTAYRLPSGRVVLFKRIRSVRLPETCARCRFNNDADCQEGFYGLRLYCDMAGGYQVGVCIQRMDLCMPIRQFVASGLPGEIMAFRKADYQQLCTAYSAP